jgi:ABC-type glycerol-3-phosphate transport system permease component
LRWALWLLQANVVARFLPATVLMIPLYVVALLQRYVVEGLWTGAVKG